MFTVMTDAYRTPGAIDIYSEVHRPIGLVREDQAGCACNPPGFLWRWWHNVLPKDQWWCHHGTCWVYSVATTEDVLERSIYNNHWKLK